MWIIYFHKIQTKDYNKISRIYSEENLSNISYNPMLISKCLIEHYCQKRSWRKISGKYGINYSTLYQIYKKTLRTHLQEKLFTYFVKREIIQYVEKKGNSILSDETCKYASLKQLDSFCFKKTI